MVRIGEGRNIVVGQIPSRQRSVVRNGPQQSLAKCRTASASPKVDPARGGVVRRLSASTPTETVDLNADRPRLVSGSVSGTVIGKGRG